MTAYRQEALRCATQLAAGPATVRAIRGHADAPRAGRILLDDVYGWFERVARGTYALTPRGRQALEDVERDPGGAAPLDDLALYRRFGEVHLSDE
jgi:hypothetical protein